MKVKTYRRNKLGDWYIFEDEVPRLQHYWYSWLTYWRYQKMRWEDFKDNHF